MDMDNRLTRCVLVSLVCHVILLVVFYLFIAPATGTPEGSLVAISFETPPTETSSPGDESADIPIPEEQEFSPETQQNLDEIEEQFSEALEEMTDDSGEYLRRQRRLVDEKRRRLQKMEQKGQEIAENIDQRSRYGTLQAGTFFGVKVLSRNVIFVLDVSGSMNIREAKRQLRNGYRTLSSAEYFNIIVFGAEIRPWRETVMAASEQSKNLADAWVRTIAPSGGTDIYGALRTALAMARDKKVEVIFFVSDGLPTSGEITQPVEILRRIRNQNKGVVIHSIGVGRHQDAVFLRTLAEQNGGKYYVR